MSANATWGTPASSQTAKNSTWGAPSTSGGPITTNRKIRAMLLGHKFGAGGGDRATKSTGLGTAVSISALANFEKYQRSQPLPLPPYRLTSPVPEGPEDDTDNYVPGGTFSYRKKLQLRQETLESLGIALQVRHHPTKMTTSGGGAAARSPTGGVLKKSGSAKSLARSNTLTNLKRVPTEIELSNGRVLRRNTSVTFSERVRCKGVQPAAVLADSPNDLWFQEEEMNKIRRNAKRAIKELEKGGHGQAETETFCLRGLERHLPGAKEESRLRVEDTWDAVLGAQDVYLEHMGEYCDNEKIEGLVRSMSRQSLKEAQERAQRDATEALLQN